MSANAREQHGLPIKAHITKSLLFLKILVHIAIQSICTNETVELKYYLHSLIMPERYVNGVSVYSRFGIRLNWTVRGFFNLFTGALVILLSRAFWQKKCNQFL